MEDELAARVVDGPRTEDTEAVGSKVVGTKMVGVEEWGGGSVEDWVGD